MAITLGSVMHSDAELTDGIGRGDVAAAARLWVRHWPTALSASRRYVDADEVPGLAAEALIGTIAAIAVGRGPREDLSAFVTAAVAELGESDEPPTPGAAPASELFVSPLMTRAFAGLAEEDQEILWSTRGADEDDQLVAVTLDLTVALATEARLAALTALQQDYLAEHTERADDPSCQQAHSAMAAAVSRAVPLAGATWVHMSECAWCTEAFHELAFSNVALDVLVDRTVVAPPAPPPAAAAVPAVAAVALPALPPEPGPEPDLGPPRSHAATLAPVGALRGRRTRIAAGALVAAAAITAAVLLVTRLDDTQGTLTAAGSETEQPQDGTTALPEAFDSVAPPVAGEILEPTPTPTRAVQTPATVARPGSAATPTARATSSAPTPRPAPTSATTPTPKPSSTQAPSPTPTTATPTPTPTATAPPCDPLAHFLGFC